MKKSLLMSVIAVLAIACVAVPAFALDKFLMKESQGSNPAGAPTPCPLAANRNGNCDNYRWYNVCSGYIWIFTAWSLGDEGGTKYGQAEGNACVAPGKVVKRSITYFRNVVANYHQTVDVLLSDDLNNDGCPGSILAQDLDLDPGLRWNCSNFAFKIPSGVTELILSWRHDGGTSPSIATDGPFTAVCDPVGTDHSYYYGIGRTQCIPWRALSPTGRGDNFLFHLILDSQVTATENTTWGAVKGLYQ